MRFNLILFVLVLVVVLEIRILWGTRDEDDDEDEVRILQPRVEFHENDIEFHEVSYERRLWPLASSLIEEET
jgi:hypothetical protein